MSRNRQKIGPGGKVFGAKTDEEFELALESARSYYSNERGGIATRNATLQMALEYALAKRLHPTEGMLSKRTRDGAFTAGAYSFRAPPALCHEIDTAYRLLEQPVPPVSKGAFVRQLIYRGLLAYTKSRSTVFEPSTFDSDTESLTGEHASTVGFNASVAYLRDFERARKVIEEQDGKRFDDSALLRLLLVRALSRSIPITKSPPAPGGTPTLLTGRLNGVVFKKLQMAHRDYKKASGENVRLGTFARWLTHAAARHRATRKM